MYDRISHDISRPGRFSSGKAQYDAMTAAAQRCDAAAAALARIPVKAFAAQPVAQEHMAALQEYTAAQNALFGARLCSEEEGDAVSDFAHEPGAVPRFGGTEPCGLPSAGGPEERCFPGR